jgi:hypothetical protein
VKCPRLQPGVLLINWTLALMLSAARLFAYKSGLPHAVLGDLIGPRWQLSVSGW